MARYVVSHGRVSVKARSSIHDTTTVWSAVSGEIEFDPDRIDGAAATVRIDMRTFDAGDRLKNWKLRGDIEPEKYPTAIFRLERLSNVSREAERLGASATGRIDWRGKNAAIRAEGSAVVTPATIKASARFDLNVRDVGVTPPKILMFKVEDVVTVEVELTANALLA